MHIPQGMGGVQLHVRTCVPLFLISGAVGKIVMNFVMLVERFTSYECYKSHGWDRYQYMRVPNLGVHGSILLKYGVFDHLSLHTYK